MRMWQTIRSSVFSRHSHQHAYAAIVLSGGYEEAGDQGRFWVEAGDVVLHDRFEAHLNRFPDSGAVVVNLPLPIGHSFSPGLANVPDLDFVIQTAETNQTQAADLLLSTAIVRKVIHADWPDELAVALIQRPSLNLSRWGEMNGLSPWAISRGFMQVFGISPSVFRARTRSRHAWKAIESSGEPLAQIAASLGFSDQPHMTRSVKQMTGLGPQAWRAAANRFKTT